MTPSSNPFGGAGAIDKRFGNTYPIIKAVYEKLADLAYLAQNLDALRPQNVEFRVNTETEYFQWRYVPEADTPAMDWVNLYPIPQATQLRMNGTWLQYRPTSEATWVNVFDTQGLISDFANTTDPAKGAALVAFLQAGVGAEATTVQEVLQRQRRSLLDFIPYGQRSAIKDGTSSYDATLAVQKAFDAAVPGMEIEIPFEIRCEGPLVLAAHNVTLSGAGGYTKSMIKCTTPGTQMLTVTGYGFRSRNIALLGDGGANGAGATIKGIRFVRADGSKDIDARLDNTSLIGMAESIYGKGANLAVMNCDVSSGLGGIVFERNGTVDECRGLRVRGTRFHSMGTIGLAAKCLQVSSDAFNCEISDNFADSIYTFYDGPINGTAVENNKLYRVAGPGINTVAATFTTQQRCGSISGNDIYCNAPSYVGDGITLRTQNARVSGNTIVGPRGHGIVGISATGNNIYGNTVVSPNFNAADGAIYDGINLDNGSTNNLVDNNHIRSAGVTARSGINVANASNIIGVNWVDSSYASPYYNQKSLLTLTQTGKVGVKKTPSADLDVLGVSVRVQKNDVIAGVPVEYQASFTGSQGEFLASAVKHALQSSSVGAEKANIELWMIQNGTMTKTQKFNWDGTWQPQVLSAPPAGGFTDALAYSDGTTGANNWGASGKGLYRWSGSAWVFVG